MKLPDEVGVMTLPNVTLFPQALRPLYIFEPRYRQMLAEALESHRLFAVAMNRPATGRETPVAVAGLGLIRVSVQHKDGTSHLILQGLTRVKLGPVVRYKPYRVHRIQLIETPPLAGGAEDELLQQVRGLLRARLKSPAPLPVPFLPESPGTHLPPQSARELLALLNSITDPEKAADMMSCTVLSSPRDRQKILETPDVQTRLRCLIRFLQRDLRQPYPGNHE